MRIFTCTPVAFGGGPDFFGRDSGLLCKGFQALGHSCKAVMPLPSGESDQSDDLIRTHAANLEDEYWWRDLRPELVVLYAWGSPRYRNVARAIRRSGAFLVLNQDNGGLVSPLAGSVDWCREQYLLSGQGRGAGAWFRFLRLVARGLSTGLLLTDPLRASHLRNGDVIACVSPKAAACYQKLCRIYGGGTLADRVMVLPHAVEPRFRYDGRAKLRRIACVGRWQDVIQKRPWLLIEVIGSMLERDDSVDFVIVGDTTPELEAWHQSLAETHRRRVRLAGRAERAELADVLAGSMVFYSPSAFESFGIAAAEALCSGTSVVAGQLVSMSAFEWFVSEQSGTLAEEDSATSHASALLDELAKWDRGERDAAAISAVWCDRLHADMVAERILAIVDDPPVSRVAPPR